MNLGRLLIAGIVVAGLGVAIYFSNKSEAAKEGKPAADAAPKILALDDKNIAQFEIKKRDGADTVAKKDDSGKWTLTTPTLAADQNACNSVASAVSGLTADRVVDDNAADLAQYGLQPALDRVTFTMKDGKTSTLLIGDQTPTGNNVYAKVDGNPKLYTMASFNKDSLDKDAKQLRDKRLMTFDQDKISRVELTDKKGSIEFGRVNQNDWQILEPKPLRADGFQVEELVRKVKNGEMDTNISGEDAKKLAASWGSSAPVATVKVTDASGTQTLEVKKAKDDYLAKSSAVEGVHKVTKDLGEGVDKSLDDFRSKKLFDFGFNDPNRIEVKDNGKTVVFEKSGNDWTSGGKKMDGTSVQALIDKLRDLAATKLLDSGFTAPVLEIAILSNDGKRAERVQIAANGMAKREGETTVYQLDPKTLDEIRSDAGDVKQAQPAPKK